MWSFECVRNSNPKDNNEKFQSPYSEVKRVSGNHISRGKNIKKNHTYSQSREERDRTEEEGM